MQHIPPQTKILHCQKSFAGQRDEYKKWKGVVSNMPFLCSRLRFPTIYEDKKYQHETDERVAEKNCTGFTAAQHCEQ